MYKENAALKSEVVFEDPLKSKTNVKRGLCSTCIHASECTYPRNLNRPVLQCEEFEGEKLSLKRYGNMKIQRIRKEDIEDLSKSTLYKGLCKLCALRDECVFPKPESGVWHCEEYI